MVAPYTGAWIEIQHKKLYNINKYVAPYTGAWIEIVEKSNKGFKWECRSLHGSVD